jgi:hypothetical protein
MAGMLVLDPIDVEFLLSPDGFSQKHVVPQREYTAEGGKGNSMLTRSRSPQPFAEDDLP